MLTAKISGVNTVLTGAKDPFLYNPRKSAAAQVNLPFIYVYCFTNAHECTGENVCSTK